MYTGSENTIWEKEINLKCGLVTYQYVLNIHLHYTSITTECRHNAVQSNNDIGKYFPSIGVKIYRVIMAPHCI